MKLLCIIPSYWPAFKYGGPIYSVHGLNKALVKKGVDVAVYTTNVGLDSSIPVNEVIDIDGVKVTYFEFTKLFEFIGTTGWQFSLPLTKALRKNLKEFDVVYIVAVWNYPTMIAAYYCRRYKKPYIIAPRGALYSHTINKKSWKKWPYYHFITKRDLKNASAIHYTTEDEAEKCQSLLNLKNQAFVIPNGINLSEFNDRPAKENLSRRYSHLKGKKIILFLGRVHWIKGLDILITAYSRLIKERNNMHLLIVGNDEEGYSEKVKGWIREYGLSYMDYGSRDKELKDSVIKKTRDERRDADVSFTGMLKGKEKLEVFTGSDIFVLPSYSENFGMAAVEAMACGVPVVISNKVGIYREVEKNKAGIVVNTNAESLYKGIKQLLENPDLREEIATNGRRLVQEYYDIDKVADRMIEMFENILNGNHRT